MAGKDDSLKVRGSGGVPTRWRQWRKRGQIGGAHSNSGRGSCAQTIVTLAENLIIKKQLNDSIDFLFN